MTEQQRLELEAAAFRRLVQHLGERNDVQNIDLMNLAGFCRNCLAKWYKAAADERGIELSARRRPATAIYGMPYAEWKAQLPERSQRRATGRLRPRNKPMTRTDRFARRPAAR